MEHSIPILYMIEWLNKGSTPHFVLFVGFELEWLIVREAVEKEHASPTAPVLVQQARQTERKRR
jgi:hypothetical protein